LINSNIKEVEMCIYVKKMNIPRALPKAKELRNAITERSSNNAGPSKPFWKDIFKNVQIEE